MGGLCGQVLRSVDSPGTLVTAVVLSHGGRMLFVGTSSGAVRSLRFPLSLPAEWSEFRAHGAAIGKVRQHYRAAFIPGIFWGRGFSPPQDLTILPKPLPNCVV